MMRATVAIILFAALFLQCFALNPVPGYEFILAGYDIRNASSKTMVDGVKYPIFVATYDMHQTVSRKDITYDVPDQVAAYPLSETTVETSTDIFHSMDEFLKEETSSFSIGIGFNLGAFGVEAGYNRTSGYIHYLYQQKDTFSAKGHLDSKLFKFALGPYPLFTLNPFFDNILNKQIPQCPSTEGDLQKVAMLIKTFGHVFPTDLFMGGRFDVVSSMDDSLVKKYDKSWVTQQLSLKFTYDGFDLYTGGFKNRTDIHVSEEFLQASKTVTIFQGGDRKLQTNETQKEWFVSIDDFPTIVEGTMVSIADLVADDAIKQKNLEYIITNHVNTGAVTAAPCAFEHKLSSGENLFEIPGTQFVGSGFDSLRMSPKGFIIDHVYGEQSWSNPFYPEYKYLVPDTMHVWDNTESVETNDTFVSMSSSQFEQQVNKRVSGHSFLGLGHHSNDMYVYQYYNEYHNDVQNTHTRTISWYDLELSPSVRFNFFNKMNPFARTIFSNLGKDITNPAVKKQYMTVLAMYGDSLITKVTMGGSIYYKTFLNNDTVKSISVEQFSSESGWSFFGLFGSKSAYNDYTKKVSETMVANAVGEIKIEGGTFNPMGASDKFKRTPTGSYSFALKDMQSNIFEWNDFIKTIKDNMVPVKYEIMPLFEIFDDAEIRANFKQCTEEYIKSKLSQ